MAWPERMTSGVAELDLFDVAQLDFERPDMERFPCLRLAYTAGETGGTGPAILNAANEIAVQGFLDKKMNFTDIPDIISRTMEQGTIENGDTLEAVLAADNAAREAALELVSVLASGKPK